jgi:hypothetical protein
VSHTQLQKLQVVQNKFLRAAFNAPWLVRNTQLHREANPPTNKEFLQDDARKCYAKAAVQPWNRCHMITTLSLKKASTASFRKPSRTKHREPIGSRDGLSTCSTRGRDAPFCESTTRAGVEDTSHKLGNLEI